MASKNLSQQLADLAARVERLEGAAAPARPVIDTGIEDVIKGFGAEDGASVVFYAGAAPWGQRTLVWQMTRSWDDVLPFADATADLFSALASPIRVRIVATLLGGAATTAELTERLDQPSSGQLFHHLKELLAVNVIYQPVRGTYAVRQHRIVPLVALFSAALDIRPPSAEGDPD